MHVFTSGNCLPYLRDSHKARGDPWDEVARWLGNGAYCSAAENFTPSIVTAATIIFGCLCRCPHTSLPIWISHPNARITLRLRCARCTFSLQKITRQISSSYYPAAPFILAFPSLSYLFTLSYVLPHLSWHKSAQQHNPNTSSCIPSRYIK